MRLLVTRPEPDGECTASQHRARGYDVIIAPLLRMEAIEADLGGEPCDAVALTSANAVRALERHPRLGSLLAYPLYTVGNRTAETACAAGFEAVISAEGDVADLARLIKLHFNGGGSLLYLAGEDRSGDLAGDLAAAGIASRTVVVYRAAPAAVLPADAQAALAAGAVDGVLHFSRRSSIIYVRCTMDAGVLEPAMAPVHYCLSAKVAEPLQAAGAGRVLIAQRPTESDLIGLIEA